MSKTELAEFIENSTLSSDRKLLWQQVFSIAEEHQIESWGRFIDNSEHRLFFITQTMSEKYEAITKEDLIARDRIVAEEEEFISSL